MTIAEALFVLVIFSVAMILWAAQDRQDMSRFDNKTYWVDKERKWRG